MATTVPLIARAGFEQRPAEAARIELAVARGHNLHKLHGRRLLLRVCFRRLQR